MGTYLEHKFQAYLPGQYQYVEGISILQNHGNKDDLLAFFAERMLPIDDIEAAKIADELMVSPPEAGYLTISNALQWRLQYSHVISEAGNVNGILKVK